MKRSDFAMRIAPMLAALTLLASLSMPAAAQEPSVSLRPHIMLSAAQEARLQAEAAKGIDALRRYLWRTRMIYGYYLPDLI